MAEYRCYVFNRANRAERVVDFTAASDAAACKDVEKLRRAARDGKLELWRDNRKIYCPDMGDGDHA